jgi:hypothetical protein
MIVNINDRLSDLSVDRSELSTYQGYVTLRFYGSSNGYYSEDAGLYEVK